MNQLLTSIYDDGYVAEVKCDCGANIWTPPPPNVIEEEDDAEHIDVKVRVAGSDEMRKGLKNVRTKIRERNKFAGLFKKDLDEEYDHFINGAQFHINSIKNMHDESVAKMKEKTSFKDYIKACASMQTTITRFCTKWNLDWSDKRALFSGLVYWRYRRQLPGRVLKSKFSVRIG
jgi:hypothetical protein